MELLNAHLNLEDVKKEISEAFPDLIFKRGDDYWADYYIAKTKHFKLQFTVRECDYWYDRTKRTKYISISAETSNKHSGMSSPCENCAEAIESAMNWLMDNCGYEPPKQEPLQLSLFDL